MRLWRKLNAIQEKERQETAAMRASGKPRPGFCTMGWGYARWFSGVSGIDTEDPS